MFDDFKDVSTTVDGVRIKAIQGGTGPALLLLHGHPQTHAIWHKVVPELTKHFTVVAADLRGYGDSGKPEGLPDHSNYSKRRMAQDQVDLMRALGYESFAVLAHDRGGRVAARMALDHPTVVTKLITLDVAPTLAMYEQTSFEFARAYWHWFFPALSCAVPRDVDSRGRRPVFEADHRRAQCGVEAVHARGVRGISALPATAGNGSWHLRRLSRECDHRT